MADLKRPKGDKYVPIFKSLLMDVEALTGLDMALDAREIERRGQNEGLSFLTKTLPSFYKHVLVCVELGHFTPIAGFSRRRKGPLPKFLGGLVDGLFDGDGNLREVRQSSWLGHIGQVCTFMYKCELPYTPQQEAERLQRFKEVEESLPESLGRFSDLTETILRNAIDLGMLLTRDFSVEERPKHGPGAVAERKKAGEKYDFHFSDRIEDEFPFDEWFGTYKTVRTAIRAGVHSSEQGPIQPYVWSGELLQILAQDASDLVRFGCELGGEEDFVGGALLDAEVPARGIFVNKDSRGPRYISAEPLQYMWLQQAVGRSIAKLLMHHPLSRGQVNFHDQTVNGDAALRASISRDFATVDLEDASDRVSLALVRLLFDSNLVRLLEACRSKTAVLPDKTVIELKKFAPMGSACCFPVECLVFYVLSVACVMYQKPEWSLERCCKSVLVYGDDIVIPVFATPVLYEVFPDLDLKVNVQKSYTQGPFRESCGTDAIDGIEVSSVKLRRPIPKSKEDVSTLISWAETSNLLFYAGYWKAANHLAKILKEFRPLPYVPYQSGIYGMTGYTNALQVRGQKIKWSKKLQRPSVKVTRVKALQSNWAEEALLPVAAPLQTLTDERVPSEIDRTFGKVEASTMYCGGGGDALSLHHMSVLL